MPRLRYNRERQLLARALRRHFSEEAVAQMMGMPYSGVRHLCRHEFKIPLPSASSQGIEKTVGDIFSIALDAGNKAVVKALREAADALERGENAKDKHL
jgi:hypothetical protein